MSKVYLNVKMRVIVDTDFTDPSDIMDYVNCYADSDDESQAMVLEHEVIDYEVDDSK